MLRLLKTRYNYLKPSNFVLPPQINGFKHVSSNPHPDSNVHLHHLVHQKTNAHFYHLQNDDPNNCFAPIIKTIIDNNKGAPHILEHLVCCGSQNYPIRDPFMNMLKRSLNTYMNAWTGEDFTAYPFSSANTKDFSNLLKVYTDMVFKANLDYDDFRQEGWRYEIGENGPEYKGIVLNQMKGVYQSPQRQLWLEVNKNLLKGTPYEFDTGGQPKQIVNLEYNQLKSLFNRFYHPSNMSFFSYGNRDFTQTLNYLNQKYLNSYEKNTQQPLIKSPVEPTHQSTIFTKDETNQIILAYYLGRLDDISTKDLMALGLVSYLLFQSNQAPMYEELIESGVGQVFTDVYGLRADKLVTFGVGLKGVQLQHSEYKSRIQSILNNVKQQGFPPHLVEQALVQTQISSIYPSKNKGIKLLQKLLGVLNHRGDIARILNYKQQLKQAKIDIENSEYRHYLIQKYFIKNNHFTVVLQQPKSDIKQSSIIPPTNLPTEKIIEQQDRLLKRQLEPMNKSILPTLQLTDINQQPPKEQIIISNSSLSIVQSPAGLSYTKVIFTPKERIAQSKLIDIWLYVINKGISTNKFNYKQLNKQVSLCSNGIHAIHGLRALTKSPFIQFSISSLDQTTQKGADLLGHFIKNMAFVDGENLKTLLIRYQNEFKNDIIQSPMDYAVSIATSLIQNIQNNEGKLLQGLQSYHFAEEYLNGKRDDQQLVEITKIVNELPYKIVVHTGDTKNIPTKIVDNFVKSFERKISENAKEYIGQKIQRKQFKSLSFTQNYDVNYCVASYYGPEMMTKQSAELSVFLELLETDYLHKKIREQGGAYGSGAKLQNGAIFFYSYADPQCENTFKNFSQSVQQLLNSTQISLEDLKQSKLSIFARIDVEPVDYQRGMNSILHGVSRADLQKYRQYVRDSDLRSVLQTGSKYLQNKQCHRIVFGKDIPSGFKQININFDNHYQLIQTIRKESN